MLTFTRSILAALALAAVATPSTSFAEQPAAVPSAAGVVRLHSANSFDETLARLKADVQAKGIRYFDTIDQSGLGASAELDLGRSTLVLFGNPPLGVQFLQSNRYSGLDWPVRMLVIEEADGSVYVAWTDFAYIADRYAISDKGPQFKMASEVAASIATAATAK
ncbi:DUF302 domain-containing protein [Altererythrobacter salegens]|uniref:DUF302 domain-containing protein n=1 Tax=Croceibacterium salegens TaxID=1737568 RepID=A0A6I4T220_9SPHN|nr:DUF302 domain-containing protein [Croceibacterium salegens]MXO61277.1 DUF302 domain-containing protein [Croceibacterium salegens]